MTEHHVPRPLTTQNSNTSTPPIENNQATYNSNTIASMNRDPNVIAQINNLEDQYAQEVAGIHTDTQNSLTSLRSVVHLNQPGWNQLVQYAHTADTYNVYSTLYLILSDSNTQPYTITSHISQEDAITLLNTLGQLPQQYINSLASLSGYQGFITHLGTHTPTGMSNTYPSTSLNNPTHNKVNHNAGQLPGSVRSIQQRENQSDNTRSISSSSVTTLTSTTSPLQQIMEGSDIYSIPRNHLDPQSNTTYEHVIDSIPSNSYEQYTRQPTALGNNIQHVYDMSNYHPIKAGYEETGCSLGAPRQCVRYIGRRLGVHRSQCDIRGNAKSWANILPNHLPYHAVPGRDVTHMPVGAIIVKTSGTYGHVELVESVSGVGENATIVTSGMNETVSVGGSRISTSTNGNGVVHVQAVPLSDLRSDNYVVLLPQEGESRSGYTIDTLLNNIHSTANTMTHNASTSSGTIQSLGMST